MKRLNAKFSLNPSQSSKLEEELGQLDRVLSVLRVLKRGETKQ